MILPRGHSGHRHHGQLFTGELLALTLARPKQCKGLHLLCGDVFIILDCIFRSPPPDMVDAFARRQAPEGSVDRSQAPVENFRPENPFAKALYLLHKYCLFLLSAPPCLKGINGICQTVAFKVQSTVPKGIAWFQLFRTALFATQRYLHNAFDSPQHLR